MMGDSRSTGSARCLPPTSDQIEGLTGFNAGHYPETSSGSASFRMTYMMTSMIIA
jgi:hypothetical protein